MISFISISREAEQITGLQENLEGVFGKSQPWELLIADGESLDIFEGFNQQAALAKGDFLAFTHDDVKFLCNRKAFDEPMRLMQKPMTGIVGVAGTRVMPKEGCWWKSAHMDCRGAVYHPSNEPHFGVHLNCWPHMAAQYGQVAVVDGVLLVCSRRTFEKIGGFDSETFDGFHFYDMSLSTEAHLHGYTNYAAPIPLLHASHGRTNDNWESNRTRYVEKYGKHLPLKV